MRSDTCHGWVPFMGRFCLLGISRFVYPDLYTPDMLFSVCLIWIYKSYTFFRMSGVDKTDMLCQYEVFKKGTHPESILKSLHIFSDSQNV